MNKSLMYGVFVTALIYLFLYQYYIFFLEDQNEELSFLVQDSINIIEKSILIHERELEIKDLVCDIKLLELHKECVVYGC